MTLAEHGDDLLAAELGEHLGFRAGRLDHDDLGFGAVIGDGEMLGPDAVDRGRPSELAGADASGSLTPFGPSKPAQPFDFTLPLRKFIAGEPMKPATNWLAGLS